MVEPLVPLAPREQAVLDLVLEGMPYDSIAKKLGIAFNTVTRYVWILNHKHGTSGRNQLALRYYSLSTTTVRSLTVRQNKILRSLLEDTQENVIARQLHISKGVVAHERTKIYQLFGMKKNDLIRLFRRKKFSSVDEMIRFLDEHHERGLWQEVFVSALAALGYTQDYAWVNEREKIINSLHQIAMRQGTIDWTPQSDLAETINNLWEKNNEQSQN